MSEPQDVLRDVWAANGAEDGLELDCGPTKQCRNMVGVSFDAMAPAGTDLRQAWRARLAAEGKLATGGGTVRDLVLGDDVPLEATGPLGSGIGR
ncbi:MAG TPA: hypothetical protein VNQ73_00910 [Ilumatobacter sp.]|nr:hypothetical protein [Ilumatobacter sp.]